MARVHGAQVERGVGERVSGWVSGWAEKAPIRNLEIVWVV